MQKQVVTSENISNAETPGYKARYVTFEEELKKKLSGGKYKKASDMGRAIISARAEVHDTQTESNRADENNVNVDVESVEFAKSALQYEYLVKSFNDDIKRFNSVIKG